MVRLQDGYIDAGSATRVVDEDLYRLERDHDIPWEFVPWFQAGINLQMSLDQRIVDR